MNKLAEKLAFLDSALCGGGLGWESIKNMAARQIPDDQAAESFALGSSGVYYLGGDGGYSRIAFYWDETNPLEQPDGGRCLSKIDLTGNEPGSASTKNWANCQELIIDVERECERHIIAALRGRG